MLDYSFVWSEKARPELTLYNLTDDSMRRIFDEIMEPCNTQKGSDSKMFELNVIPERIIVSGPCTIFFWNDKTKTVVRCSKDDYWDISDAIVAAYTKRLLGDKVYSSIKQKSNSKRIRDMIEWKE